MSYTSIDRAVSLVRRLGKSSLLVKLDLKEAYRAIPVHPSDQRLLAVSWMGSTYIDKALPFGLRSAPKLFTALTDAMMWVLHQRGVVTALHYLDDFLLLGPPRSVILCRLFGTHTCPVQRTGLSSCSRKDGRPHHSPRNRSRHCTRTSQVAPRQALPPERYNLAVDEARRPPNTPWFSKETRSAVLAWMLTHAASVVQPGRAFIRSLIDAAATALDPLK